jgi:mannitol/fructose-specific phosphotransferase system IIA component (Ntr-type)/galactitol-specific phosphotransferase system IIB component
VKDQYPYIHSVVEQSSEPISKTLNRRLTEVEIGEIMICLIASLERLNLFGKVKKKVLVVCSAGMATAWLLVSRLRTEFPDLEVVDVISVLDLEKRKKFIGIDFIIGTVPIRIKNIPCLQVNPLLGVEDFKSLREFFKGYGQDTSTDASIGSAGVHLNALITPASIALGMIANSWQEVVEIAGGKLVEAGSIEPEFVRSMKEIVIDHGPYMVIWPGAVLLHAPPKGVKHLCMQFVSLKEPVYFGHPDNDPVRIAIVLGAVDDHSHYAALMELNALMQDKEARAVIDTTAHKTVVLHWVAKYSR